MLLERWTSLAITVFLLLAGLCVAQAAPSPPAEKTVALTVTNGLDHPRRGAPVTSGIPLPEEWRITDPSRLTLTDGAGRPLPVQFRVLSRWGALEDLSRPIRWVLADFQADVPPRSDASFILGTGGKSPSVTGIRVKEDASGVHVDTGALRFSIGRDGFDLLRSAEVAGGEKRLAFGGEGRGEGLRILRSGRLYSSAWGAPDRVEVEEAGPLRTVLLVRGKFYDRQGRPFLGGEAAADQEKAEGRPLRYAVRIHAFYGKPFVKLVCTLENEGNGLMPYYPMNDARIDAFSLDVPLGAPSGMTVFAEGKTARFPAGESFRVEQGYALRNPEKEKENFLLRTQLEDKEEKTRGRGHGWLDAGLGDRGVTVAVRNFWQRFPKEVEAGGGRVRVDLLGAGGAETYFSGGWHMTDEVWLYFHPGDWREARAPHFALGALQPLFARCDPRWYVRTRAWGVLAPDLENAARGELGKTLNRYEQYRRMLVDPSASKEELSLQSLREGRHLGRGHYGWADYGDLAWKGDGGPFSALHYDWPYILWLQFLRSADGRYLPLARDMTDHSADMDQIHSDAERGGGVWWWEEIGDGEGHHKSLHTAGLILSHTWNGGYALGYLLTGDSRYREAAMKGVEAAEHFWARARAGEKVPQGQARSQGWSILLLVNGYRVTGEARLLHDALKIFENSLLYTEQLEQPPGSGGVGSLSYNEDYQREKYYGKAVVTFATYHLEPLGELHWEARRAGLDVDTLEKFLVRSLDWLKDWAYVGGRQRPDGKYSLLTLSYATDLRDRSQNTGGELAHNVHVAGAFGYGHLMLREKDPAKAQDYLRFARHLFRDLMFYRMVAEKEKDDFHDPRRLSPVGWGWLPTATKEIGWIGRGGQPYLHAEYLLLEEAAGGAKD